VFSSNIEGGVIYIAQASSLRISSSSFYNMTAKQGGFIYVSNTPSVSISNCNFTNGTASAGYGGAVCRSEYFLMLVCCCLHRYSSVLGLGF
jgi:hypothetical protein